MTEDIAVLTGKIPATDRRFKAQMTALTDWLYARTGKPVMISAEWVRSPDGGIVAALLVAVDHLEEDWVEFVYAPPVLGAARALHPTVREATKCLAEGIARLGLTIVAELEEVEQWETFYQEGLSLTAHDRLRTLAGDGLDAFAQG